MYILRNIFLQYGVNTKLNIGKPNAVLIKNTGAVRLTVNKFPIDPGEVFTSNLLQPDMIDETLYNIEFDPAGVGDKLVNVIASFVAEDPHSSINTTTSNGAKC